jgi:hypothetical protein
MQDILESFPSILTQIDPTGKAVEPLVFAAWKRCVDGALAEHVLPLRLEKNRLIAAVSSETWRRNVADLGPALAAKLNAALGSQAVRFIEFQVDAAAVREHRRRSNQGRETDRDRTAIAARMISGLRPSAESIADDQLREQFLAAAASSLSRSEILESSNSALSEIAGS